MPPKLSRDDVLAVAALARLELSTAEIEQFAGQLAKVLEFAGAIQRADTTGIVPTASLSPEAAWREDVARPSLDRDTVIAQAPDADTNAGLFRVPKVL